MRFVFFSTLVLFFLGTAAQDCNEEMLLQKTGSWKNVGYNPTIANIAQADMVKEKQVLSNIHKLIADGYTPQGCQSSYSFRLGKNLGAAKKYQADPYVYSIWVRRYRCDPKDPTHKKDYIEGETPTGVTITANVWFELNTLWASALADNESREYFKLDRRPVRVDEGVYYLGEELTRNGSRTDQGWLITYGDGQFPFEYVNRKEYCEMLRRQLNKSINESPGDKAYFEGFLQKISAYLSSGSAEELNKIAICMWNDEERFNGFVEEGTGGSFLAIRPNTRYYKTLPKSSPQFFTVYMSWEKGDPVYEKNMEVIKKQIDFKTMRSWLGK